MKQFSLNWWWWLFALGSALGPLAAQAQGKLRFDPLVWEEVHRDDFNGTQLDTTLWQTFVPYGGKYFGWGSEWYDSTPDRPLVTVAGGAAHLRAVRWHDENGQLINLVDSTNPKRTVRYRSGLLLGKRDGPLHEEGFGAWEARLKLPVESGAWPAFWLFSGPTEIDILDGVNYDADVAKPGGILNNVIQNNSPPPSYADECRYEPWDTPEWVTHFNDDYHVYTLVWTPELVAFFLDGREIRTVPKSVVGTTGNVAHDLMVSMQTYVWADADESFALDVDYVRVLKPRRLPSDGTPGVRDYSVAMSTYEVPDPTSRVGRLLRQLGRYLW